MRYRLEEDKDDGAEPRRPLQVLQQENQMMDWELEAEGVESALVPRKPSRSNDHHNTIDFQPQHYPPQERQPQQPVFYVVAADPRHGYLNSQQLATAASEYDDDENSNVHATTPSRNGCCGCCRNIWVQFLFVSLLSLVVYYVRTQGPPGPPTSGQCHGLSNLVDPSFCTLLAQDEEEEPQTWDEYTQKHNLALSGALRAYLIDTTWHVLSWIVPQMVLDLQEAAKGLNERLFQSTQNQQACSLSSHNNSSTDLYQKVMDTIPMAQAQPHAILPFVQKVEKSLWDHQNAKERQSLVFWASLMTPGLAVEQFAQEFLELVLGSCPSTQLPLVVLEATEEKLNNQLSVPLNEEYHTVLWANRIRRRIEKWRGHGGIVVVQHADRLPPPVLRRLLEALRGSPDGLADESSILEQSNAYFGDAVQNVVFLFTSEKIGRASMTRHLRLKGNVSDVARSSLLLDMQHEISTHLNSPSSFHSPNIVEPLPFWFLTRQDAERMVPAMLENVAMSSLGWRGLAASPSLRHEMLSDKRVEFVRWNVVASDAEPFFEISTHGVVPLLDQMQTLASEMRKHCGDKVPTDRKSQLFRLDFSPSTQRITLQDEECDDGAANEKCASLCSFHF